MEHSNKEIELVSRSHVVLAPESWNFKEILKDVLSLKDDKMIPNSTRWKTILTKSTGVTPNHQEINKHQQG